MLDRALISHSIRENKTIEEQDVREMLGLADKSKLILLFKNVLEGNENKSLNYLKELIDNGLDAKNFLNDILEVLYLFSRRINLGPIQKDMSVSETEVQMVEEFSKNKVPCVVGEYQEGYKLILTNEDLKNLGGNVDLFFDMLKERIELHHHSELKT